MPLKKCVLTLLIIASSVCPSMASEVQGPGTEMLVLYQQGDVTGARQSLHRELQGLLPENYQPFTRQTHLDAEAYLSSPSIAANVLAAALTAELRHVTSAPAPDKLLDMVDKVAGMVAAAEREIASSGLLEDHPRLQRNLQYAKRQRANLFLSAIVLNRSLGRPDAAGRLIESHQAFLTAQNVPLEDFAPDHVPANPEASTEPESPITLHNTWTAAGPMLPITKLLLGFYEAMAVQDEEALDHLLHAGEGYMNGAALLATIEAESMAEGDFDEILMPEFDNATHLLIQRTGPDRYNVRITGVIKRFKLNDAVTALRETDHFTLTQSHDNTYHIMIPEAKDAE